MLNLDNFEEYKLFFKLYLLARRDNYINYMQQTRELARWFDFKDWREVDTMAPCPTICGNCFNIYPSQMGGGILINCHKCFNETNLMYELNQLSDITHTNNRFCSYFLCLAVESIYESRDTKCFQYVVW